MRNSTFYEGTGIAPGITLKSDSTALDHGDDPVLTHTTISAGTFP